MDNSRRITNPSNQPPKTEDRLKNIAGLIQKLTFAEMNELAKLIHEDVDTSDKRIVPYGLLKISERILDRNQPLSATLTN